ncbi:MAG: N-acetylmuramoyl-L-alanine amidase [Hyphomicrobium sp.]
MPSLRWGTAPNRLLQVVVVAILSLIGPLQVSARAASLVEVSAAGLEGDATATTFSLTMSKGVTAEVFTLADPYRIIVDLPDVVFNLPASTGSAGQGLVKVFRFGLFAEHKARVVIETTGPVKVLSAEMTRASSSGAVQLKLALAATDAAAFAAGAGRPRSEADETARASAPDVTGQGAPAVKKLRPVIVIDAGHGGIDPGASGPNHMTEKAVVFAVAQHLEKVLKSAGRYDVKMTRTRDVFVSLDRRLKMSNEVGADLFISLHADAIAETAFAENIRGATVYTLSERATDEQARLMAEKENASDLIAGLSAVDESGKDQVVNILFDLMRRETSNFATDFSNLLVQRLSKSIVLSRDPQRSAAFKVLKQAHAPSVLVELGYMSNSKDQSEMTAPAWQLKVASSIAAAIDSYFAKRTARQP